MTERILLPPVETPARKFWKPWKWIGLILFAASIVLSGWLPSFIVIIGCIYGIVVIANLTFFVFRFMRDRFFWRVRNRIICSILFGGLIPLLILIAVVFLSTYLLFIQLGMQYLNQSMRENVRLVSEINAELGRHISAGDAAKVFPAKAAAVFAEHAAQFPQLAARLLRKRPAGNLEVISTLDSHAILPDISPYPGDKWLGRIASFEGLLRYKRELFLTSLQPVSGSSGLYMEITAPLDGFIEGRLGSEKSLYVIFLAPNKEIAGINGNRVTVTTPDKDSDKVEDGAMENQLLQKNAARGAYLRKDPRSMVTAFMPLQSRAYDTGKAGFGGLALFTVPWKVILDTYVDPDNLTNRSLLVVIYVLAGLFVATSIISLIIGLMISRHVTRSVHDMYQGILALQKGDLQHRIPVRRKDQLGLMANSFNQMSASIARLLDEVVEKKRLEQELKIAREVQTTLFPKQLPHPPGMAIFGGCKPARVVSGDYYDFIVEDETRLDIVVGDISGKGISAALLMANLQAMMRNQLLSGHHDERGADGQKLADVMTQLNRQIYLNSPAEKYATLFLSRYDASTHRLWYCNAGHLPPIVMNEGEVKTLAATGTVIGMFPDAVYEAKCIDLTPGTTLAIFTDGITEALNKADEEFGNGNLLAALQQSSSRSPEDIWEHVMSKVGEWQSDLPQYDDMTLIVTKAS